MALSPGTRLGSYEIAQQIGAGGMGEVYRARDAKLGRDVALKILPDTFAADPHRLARFRREAQVLASLNHPNIAAIYGLEESPDGPAKAGPHVLALVLELVEGPTLADRIARGALPVHEALAIAKQIAEALEAAHEKGIVHRDLKPANVKVTSDGKVKVLDFGLAKAMTDDESAAPHQPQITQSPTLSVMATQAGIILGTAAYMSPEQAQGLPVDHRSDIFSFGSVLYEILTGRQAFSGDTAAAILASVLIREPDLSNLPANLDARVDELVRRCIDKNPKRRWQAVGDLRAEIEAVEKRPYRVAGEQRSPLWKRALPVVVAAVLAAAVTSAVWWQRQPPALRAQVVRFPILLASGQQFVSFTVHNMAVSPDGSQVVYGGVGGGLYRRSLADPEVHLIGGTDRSQGVSGVPVFSPDGRSLAFLTLTTAPVVVTLKTVEMATGAVTDLSPIDYPFGLSWDPGGILVGQGAKGIVRVSPNGGTPKSIVSVGKGELAHGPQMLPDGDHVLFTLATIASGEVNWDNAQIVVQSLRSGERKTLIHGGSESRYVDSGHIVYAVGGALFAVPFDVARLEIAGERRRVLDGVRRSPDDLVPVLGTAAQYSVSGGTLAYVPGPSTASAARSRGLAFGHRKGSIEPLSLPPGLYDSPRISPDGTRVAFSNDDGKDANIFVYDLDGKSQMKRVTFGGQNRSPVWSPDSTRVAFQSDRDGISAIWSQRADGSGTAVRLTKPDKGAAHVPESWSSETILFGETKNGRTALKSYSTRTNAVTPFAGVESPDPINSVFSPDGRLVAYTIREPGTTIGAHSVYVQPFPPTGTIYQISKGEDAHHPLWSRDGRELFYIPGPLRFVSVNVTTQPSFAIGNPTALPRGAISTGTGPLNVRNHDITLDGTRFVGVVPSSSLAAGNEMQVVVNWTEELKRLVPAK